MYTASWGSIECFMLVGYFHSQTKKMNEKFEEKSIGEINDNNETKISVYRFLKDENETERRLNIIRKVNVNLKLTNESVICRSSCPEVFCKIDAFRNFATFSGKPLCQSLFFNKVAAGLQLYQKRDSDTGFFLWP